MRDHIKILFHSSYMSMHFMNQVEMRKWDKKQLLEVGTGSPVSVNRDRAIPAKVLLSQKMPFE